MKILVTGAAGFLGSHMSEQLCKIGHLVYGIDNLANYYDVSFKKQNLEQIKHPNFIFFKLDLCNDNLLLLDKDFDFIFHFAAQPGLSSASTFQSYLNNNVVATQNLLEFAKYQLNLKHFFNISTSSVYGKYANVSEDYKTQPISYYGVTKLAAEQLVLAASRQNSIKASSFRLYSVYGPRERPDKLFTKLIDCVLNNKKFPLYQGSLNHLRSFTFVQDIVNGLLIALKKHDQINGEIINLGHFENKSTQEAILTVENQLKKHIHFEYLPSRNGDQKETRANINKAKLLLNYQPKTSLVEGVRQQIEWFKTLKHESVS